MKRGWYVALIPVVIAGAADAQYRWRGEDGQINYGDQPPANARELQRVDARAPLTSNDTNPALTFELRRAIARHPAVLYTSADCPGCDAARVFLRQRGIPYAERTVEAPEDVETLRRLTGTDKVPALTLGSARFPGFNSAEWGRGLDAAGYPADARLPPGYAGEPPQPLVARSAGPATPAGSAPRNR